MRLTMGNNNLVKIKLNYTRTMIRRFVEHNIFKKSNNLLYNKKIIILIITLRF